MTAVLVLGSAGIAIYFVSQAASRLGDLAGGGIVGEASCPAESEVAAVVGSPVRPPQSLTLVGTSGCAYFAVDPVAGVDVNLVSGPDFIADERLREFADEGAAAQAQTRPVPVGDRGLAWASNTKSAATAVGGGRLVLVEIMSSSQEPIGDRTDAAIALLQRLLG